MKLKLLESRLIPQQGVGMDTKGGFLIIAVTPSSYGRVSATGQKEVAEDHPTRYLLVGPNGADMVKIAGALGDP